MLLCFGCHQCPPCSTLGITNVHLVIFLHLSVWMNESLWQHLCNCRFSNTLLSAKEVSAQPSNCCCETLLWSGLLFVVLLLLWVIHQHLVLVYWAIHKCCFQFPECFPLLWFSQDVWLHFLCLTIFHIHFLWCCFVFNKKLYSLCFVLHQLDTFLFLSHIMLLCGLDKSHFPLHFTPVPPWNIEFTAQGEAHHPCLSTWLLLNFLHWFLFPKNCNNQLLMLLWQHIFFQKVK